MATILAVWELGAGNGHIDRMLVVARALRARGHRLVFALRDLSRAHACLAHEGIPMLQAPVWLPQLAHPPRLANYAAVLAHAGWLDAAGLTGLVAAWRELFTLVRPDALLCDHAPTAMLAARGRGFPVWAVGNSFEVPPAGEAFAPLRWWEPGEIDRCPDCDRLVLEPVRRAQALLGDAPLARLTDLFDPARSAVVSIPELSHYRGYPAATPIVGPTFVGDRGAPPPWPDGPGPRVFGYLSPAHAGATALVAAAKALGLVTLVHMRGIPAEARQRLGGGRVRIEPHPLRIDLAVQQADLVVSHASVGTTSAAALAGKPQLLLPTQTEQLMVARRAVDAGIAAVLDVQASQADATRALRHAIASEAMAAAARGLARRCAGMSPERTGERVAGLVAASL